MSRYQTHIGCYITNKSSPTTPSRVWCRLNMLSSQPFIRIRPFASSTPGGAFPSIPTSFSFLLGFIYSFPAASYSIITHNKIPFSLADMCQATVYDYRRTLWFTLTPTHLASSTLLTAETRLALSSRDLAVYSTALPYHTSMRLATLQSSIT